MQEQRTVLYPATLERCGLTPRQAEVLCWVAQGKTGLSVPSKIHATKLVTLSRALLRRWLGQLGPFLTVDLDRALIAALSINTTPYREEGRRDERARLANLFRAGGASALLADLGLPAARA